MSSVLIAPIRVSRDTPVTTRRTGAVSAGGSASFDDVMMEERMPQRVNLDAMIPREDFAREATDTPPSTIINELNVNLLVPDALVRRLLRKPEFQRETNHWSPEQVAKFLTSFADSAVIPSIILWRSTNYIFVIDGAHRLSALCAWIADDYGDRAQSQNFYGGEISDEQKRIAARARNLVNSSVGSFSSLALLVGTAATGLAGARSTVTVTRPIVVQQVFGTPKVAEASFFAINTQGTELDETETFLIKNRETPVAIGARDIVRAGRGHPYWSTFSQDNQFEVIRLAAELYKTILQPDVTKPLKSLDLPLGGSSSPVDALAVLIDFLTVANTKNVEKMQDPESFGKDNDGLKTIEVLKGGLKIARRLTGNSSESLGLHPAVYFTNDKGKHSRFLFLGMSALIREKVVNNDDGWFKKFTAARAALEDFLIEHKTLIGIVLQNLHRSKRIPKMRDLFSYLVTEITAGNIVTPEGMIANLGLKGKTYDITMTTASSVFTDDTKSQIFYRDAINNASRCSICRGRLDVGKAASYDHIVRVREGGLGDAENGRIVHPYCNTGIRN